MLRSSKMNNSGRSRRTGNAMESATRDGAREWIEQARLAASFAHFPATVTCRTGHRWIKLNSSSRPFSDDRDAASAAGDPELKWKLAKAGRQ
jgi:hypothetical protein